MKAPELEMGSRARSERPIDAADAKTSAPVAERIASLAWDRIAEDLDRYGCAVTGPVRITTGAAAALIEPIVMRLR